MRPYQIYSPDSIEQKAGRASVMKAVSVRLGLPPPLTRLSALSLELLVKGLLALMGYISYEPQSIPVKQHFHFLIK